MSYDVVVIGAGCEGLACAALAARAGRRVLVLERRDAPGGLAAEHELAPGYRVPGFVHELGTPDPRLDVLDLDRHGLRARAAAPAELVVERDGPGLVFERDPARVAAALGARRTGDPARYAELCAYLERLRRPLGRLLFAAAPTPRALDWRELARLLGPALGLRRLGRRDLTELLRFAPMPAADWVGEHLEDELARLALVQPALRGTRHGPRAPHGAFFAALAHLTAGPANHGGPAAVARALAAAATAQGVELRTGVAVRRVVVEDGRARGVELANGETIDARHVVASCDPHTAATALLSARDLPERVRAQARNWRARGDAGLLFVALSAPLELERRPGERFEVVRIADGLDGLERAADAAKYDELPERPALELRVPSLDDPGLAPDGHEVLSIRVRTVPYALRGGWTDDARAGLTERVLALVEEHAPNLRAAVVATELWTPADLERELGTRGGHLLHGELGLDQTFTLRPGPDLCRGRTPIDGFWLASRGVHPGPFLLGGPGAQAAELVAAG